MKAWRGVGADPSDLPSPQLRVQGRVTAPGQCSQKRTNPCLFLSPQLGQVFLSVLVD